MIRSNRIRRATLKARALTTRAAVRIRRNGAGTLASHAMAHGLCHRDAASMVGTLRKVAAKLGVIGATGRVHAGRRMRDCARFTPQQVAAIALNYKPRRAEFKICAARLALAA
ncbi:hypothetical protein GCM10009837_07410 [Streptomyces durmitorensis]|uniref:Uncharacterized protein n=1 Tax=Streptomyces durmitorensis TaxID=319947 RepID=A0ABY4PLU8_9ACTN|nr:hypothetical protein [Streptomyces durmitorensis]UQT54367.1 hypothetical protein M4V62_04290 [Streptomyces durmitorensis]